MIIQQQQKTPAQKRFVRLMDLYEQNYCYLHKLIPHLYEIDGQILSVKRNAIDLHLQLLEKEKYTATILLTHHFLVDDQAVSNPNLIVRIYNDAKIAEALSAQLHEGQVQLSQLKVGLSERNYVNRFLNKWLRYLLKQGHVLHALEQNSDVVLFSS